MANLLVTNTLQYAYLNGEKIEWKWYSWPMPNIFQNYLEDRKKRSTRNFEESNKAFLSPQPKELDQPDIKSQQLAQTPKKDPVQQKQVQPSSDFINPQPTKSGESIATGANKIIKQLGIDHQQSKQDFVRSYIRKFPESMQKGELDQMIEEADYLWSNSRSLGERAADAVTGLFKADARTPTTEQAVNSNGEVKGTTTRMPSFQNGAAAIEEPTPQPTNIPALKEDVPYRDAISSAAEKNGLDPLWLAALLKHESAGFQEKYVHGYHTDGTGRGIAAIDKKWHPQVTDEQAFDPDFAINWAAKYFKRLVDKHDGNYINALREYNGGHAFTRQTIGFDGRRTIDQITKDYVKKVKSNKETITRK